MHTLTEKDLRASFVNASQRERNSLTLPDDFGQLDWEELDFLGWRDAKYALQGYVVVPVDGAPVGILLRESEQRARTRPQCSWCEDVTLPNDVVFFSAKRAGRAGRNGDTVGTLVCARFECQRNVRKLPPLAYPGFDRDAARQRRIEALHDNVLNFARDIRDNA
ncbi:FBP domain-containing protein [Microbacterium horticulturae]|uniref:FBP domain-containing protein n=1 Tax=Microbacterium horticulturae TaxID=3028316 RepID=A0ABY8C279_9MICO|nr:FBP domain-containing protein [Microbacterium sp. KACC 23027]WEG10553.1 FBP domain-containing protein [Microbacterium sp. KACC 23027]